MAESINIEVLKKKYYTNNKLSHHAVVLIDNILKDKNIIMACEYLSHDGYDRHGPQSNLWDLYIIFDDDLNVIHNYHWEDWFNGKSTFKYGYTKYKFYHSFKITEKDPFDLKFFEKDINKTDNDKLKEIFNLRMKEIQGWFTLWDI
jgi:hypothetical protein